MKNINAPADLDEHQEAIEYMESHCKQYSNEVKEKIWELITTRGSDKLRFGPMPEGI